MNELENLKMMETPEPAGWVILQPPPFATYWNISVWPNWWRRFWYWALLGWTFTKENPTTHA